MKSNLENRDNQISTGIFYGIGVGPGEASLLTKQAERIIRNMDILILPAKDKEHCRAYQSVEQEIPEISQMQCDFMPFPMSMNEPELTAFHQEVALKVEGYLQKGFNVGFLTIGDVCIYSTFDYIEAIVKADGYFTQYISGIPSFCAVAAKLGIPLTMGKESLHIVSGNTSIEKALTLDGTIVFMKSGKKMAELKEVLMREEQKQGLDVRAVSNCGLSGEQVVCGANNLLVDAGYLTVVIVRRTGR